MGKDKISLAFDKWKERVSNGYIKAVCKPCWEMKYCPYGSLVEDFPIGDFGNDETCRIFGHTCPVFYVAEPFTETKEMRNISRNIPMLTKLKVVRRDRYLCAMCKKTISDEEINYDHIIPWSKGGATTESNLRILCTDCNRKRGNEFESEYLVVSVQEAKYSPMTLELSQIEDMLSLFSVACVLREVYGTLSKDVFCAVIKTDDVESDEFMYTLIEGINNVFCKSPFFIKTKKKETILKYRWGLVDGRVHSIYETCKKYHITEEYFCGQEDLLLRQIGFIINKKRLLHKEFYRQVEDIIEVGLRRYNEKYKTEMTEESPFVLYEKYSRRDVCLLMNCGKDLSSTMYGMKRIGDDVFIFVTYHKQESKVEDELYVAGKPDYADAFEDNVMFKWDSQIGKGVDSSYMEEVRTAKRKHLLVKKSDAETNFYYMGLFDILDVRADKKEDKNGKLKDIAKVTMRMRKPVRDDLLRYLQSTIQSEGDKTV